jgi:3',5'-cyclic AMP phosphodiesterase CpdA
MTRIAHLSDLHLLEPAINSRRGQARLRVNYLSFRRPIDYESRRQRALNALAAACQTGFDHLVVTGDLTEDGAASQFEVLAEVLATSGIPAERVTLLPGNHDAYGAGDGWVRALEGPLAPWAPSSRGVTWLDDCAILPISSAVHQSCLRSSGRVETADLDRVDAVARAEPTRTVVLAQHHAPFPVIHQWVHGLLNHDEVTGLMYAHANVSLLHGHIHRRRERGLFVGGPLRIFSSFAVADNASPLRMYDVAEGLLHPVATLGARVAQVVEPIVEAVEALGDVIRHDVGVFGEVLRQDVEALRHDVEALGEAVRKDAEALGLGPEERRRTAS